MSNITHLQGACDQLTNPSLPERVSASSEKCCICKKTLCCLFPEHLVLTEGSGARHVANAQKWLGSVQRTFQAAPKASHAGFAWVGTTWARLVGDGWPCHRRSLQRERIAASGSLPRRFSSSALRRRVSGAFARKRSHMECR